MISREIKRVVRFEAMAGKTIESVTHSKGDLRRRGGVNVLHEIPQEIGDFGVLLHAGFSKTKALFFNFLSAAFAIFGAIAALLLGNLSESFAIVMLPIAAGGFIYVAGSDLVTELQHEVTISKSSGQLAALAAGAGLMMLLP